MKNSTQQDILDRLNSGEERIYYHPQSVIGSEVIEMRDSGEIEIRHDENGFTYIARPSADEE